jgi:hypothetical protein
MDNFWNISNRQGELYRETRFPPFFSCAEGLSCMSKFSIPHHVVKSIRVGLHAPCISHFVFAYDCLVFAQATETGGDESARYF